jgi:hypothetical protein
MRLTLRTLLAYMDDILDPGDQEELGRKIESSPFATELIHRSRDAVRRVRLSAPDPMAGADDDIHGGDHNLDANTAAEYLDNTLSPEAVADFERSCLEAGPNADMLLAEAASCHHVLTMVLGEPAEVDADLRQRLYALAQSPAAAQQLRIEPAHTPTPIAAPAPPAPVIAAAAVPTMAPRRTDIDPDEAGVPDYILAAARERRRGRRMVAAMIGALLVGGGVTWFLMYGDEAQVPSDVAAMGDVDEIREAPTVAASKGSESAGSTGDTGDATAEPGGAESAAPPFNPDTATASSQPAADGAPVLETPPLETPVAATTAPVVTLPPEVPGATEEESGETAAAPAGDPGTAAVVGSLPAADAATDTTATAPMADTEASASATGAASEALTSEATAPVVPPQAAAAASSTGSQVEGPSGAGPITAAASAPPAGEAERSATGPVTEAEASSAAPETPFGADAASASATQPKPIGAYLGNNDVLLRLDPAQNEWIRVPPRSAFIGGEQLLSLPTFRTHVVLADVNAYLSGGAQIDLIPPGQNAGQPAAEFALHIPYGRIILNSGLNGNRVELSLVDQNRVVELGPSSSLAVEVRRIFEPGSSVRREPAPAEVDWYLTSGTAQWGESGNAQAPAAWTTIGGEDSVPVAVDELPEWVDHEPISDIERRARERVAEALVPGEPVNTRLLEMSDPTGRGRRTEDRALAARSGAYVGMYDTLVTALGDVNQKAAWRSHIDALRQAIARDPTAVEGIHAAFALERGEEAADDLMEMLLGFDRAAVGTNRDEVKAGAMVRLLRWMEHDDLIYRVLASHNVNEILGRQELGGYKPEQSASQRERMLARVWERFERGELVPPDLKANQ